MSKQQLEQLFDEAQSLLSKGAHTEAYKILKKLDQRVPNHPGILYSIGVCQSSAGNKTNAVETYKRVVKIHPSFIEAYNNMGLDLIELGRPTLAIDHFDAALNIRPDFKEAAINKASVLISLQRTAEALDVLDVLYKQHPQNPLVLSNLGKIFAINQKRIQALEFFETALQHSPNNSEILEGKLMVLVNLQRWEDLLEAANQALANKPDHQAARLSKIVANLQLNNWSEPESKNVQAMMLEPLYYLYLCTSLKLQVDNARAYSKQFEKVPTTSLPPPKSATKIRVGYFSCDFREHPIAHLTAGLYEAHDKNRFEIYCYAIEPTNPPESPIRQRIKDGCDHFLSVGEQSDQVIIDMARAHNLDIAIDLTGYTEGARIEIFSQRVAPIQISYLGFPGSSGATFIDYIIGDPVVTPEVLRDCYSEKVIVLPDCFQCNDQFRRIGQTLGRVEYGLPENAFVLACFNLAAKINEELFSCWMRLLQAIPDAVLWLAPALSAQIKNLDNEAIRQGIDPQRLIFASRLPYDAHLARYAHADIVLDTFPFNGGTTTSDALWGGAPVVTRIGETYSSRMSASLLTALGLPELITTSVQEYEALVLRLSVDRKALADIRRQLANNRLIYPIFDTVRFTKNLERAFEIIVEHHRAGLIPQHIEIASGSSVA